MPRVKKFDRNEVLFKAMHLFWKKGYHATSVQNLVDHLGINRGSLYDTYGGKKKLFDETIRLYTSTNQKFLCDFFSSKKNVKEILRGFFKKILDTDFSDADCKGCFVVNTTTELLPTDLELQKVIEDYGNHIVRSIFELLKKGTETGAISPDKDIKTIANLLYTLMNGIRVNNKSATNKNKSLAEIDAALMLLD